MEWIVLLDDDFEAWLVAQTSDVRVEIAAHLGLLAKFDPRLGRPQVDTLQGSSLPNLKELRVQIKGDPWRVLFALIPSDEQLYYLAVINVVISGGTNRTFRLQKRAIVVIYKKWRVKPMTKTLEQFLQTLSQAEQVAIAEETERLISDEMTLQELRQARQRSQEVVGKLLHVNQAAVSKLERRTDMYVSTLRSFIQAMGGDLEIIARFPDRPPVRINQFEELNG